jgi:hypothetical protein
MLFPVNAFPELPNLKLRAVKFIEMRVTLGIGFKFMVVVPENVPEIIPVVLVQEHYKSGFVESSDNHAPPPSIQPVHLFECPLLFPGALHSVEIAFLVSVHQLRRHALVAETIFVMVHDFGPL